MLLDKPDASTGNFVRTIEKAVSAIPGIIVGNPLIFALLVFSATIRAYGVFWGVTVSPFDISLYHPDEPKVIHGAFNFPSDILKRTDLRYPTAQHYIIGILSWPLAKLAGVAGISGYDAVYMSARAISVAMGTLSVGFTYLAGRKIFNHHVGLLSAAMLSVAPMHVANSSWATLDVPNSLWLIVFCWLLVRSNSCLQHWGWLGFTLGLLVGTKYTGGMAVVVLLAAVVAELRQSSSWGYTVRELAANRRLWAIGGIAAAVFFASTPSILINPDNFFESIAFLRAQLANAGQPLWQTSVWTQQFHKFASALGIPIVIAGGIGIAGCFVLASGRKLRPFALMLLVFCCYFGGALIPRYIIFVAPLCALLAGYALAILWISAPPPPPPPDQDREPERSSRKPLHPGNRFHCNRLYRSTNFPYLGRPVSRFKNDSRALHRRASHGWHNDRLRILFRRRSLP